MDKKTQQQIDAEVGMYIAAAVVVAIVIFIFALAFGFITI